jgi:hypothetical protein
MLATAQLESGDNLTNIPVMKNIAKQTVLTFFAHVNLES